MKNSKFKIQNWGLLLLAGIFHFSFLTFNCAAADIITATITVTNTGGTTNGQTLVVNGATRTWTNSVVVPGAQVLTNSSIGGSASNLFTHLAITPFSALSLARSGTNGITLQTAPGGALTVTLSAGWGAVVLTTNTLTSAYVLRLPVTVESAAPRTNITSLLVTALNDSSQTNSIFESSTVAANLVGITNAQAVSGSKSFTGTTYFTNAASVKAGSIVTTNLSVTSGILNLVSGHGTGTTNTWQLSGDVDSLDLSWVQLTGAGGSGYMFGSVFNSDGSFTWPGSMVVTGAVVAGSIVLTNGPFTGNGGALTNLDGGSVTGFVANATLSTRSISNSTHWGTNYFPSGSDISFGRYAVTSLANGNNAAVPVGTNVFVEVSGPSAAFTICGINASPNRDGKLVVIVNQTGFDMTIAHQSGTDPAAANRIINMTGADRTTTGNGTATLIYSASAARWLLINFDP